MMAKKKGIFKTFIEGWKENQKAVALQMEYKRREQERRIKEEERRIEMESRRYCPICRRKLIQQYDDEQMYNCKYCGWSGIL